MKAVDDHLGCEPGGLNPKATHLNWSLPGSSLKGRAIIQVQGCVVAPYRNLEPEWTSETITDKGSILQKRKPNLTSFRMKGCAPQQEKPHDEKSELHNWRKPAQPKRNE